MGATHRFNLARSLQAVAKGKYFVIVESPTKESVGANNRVQSEDLPYIVVSLRARKDPAKFLASMNAQTLPGCCGVVVFYNFAGDKARVAELIEIGYAGAKLAGYGEALLTLVSGSGVAERLRVTPDFGAGYEFRNGKTNNMVVMIAKDLEQAPRAPIRNDTGGE